MKRTLEIVLSVIALALQLFVIIVVVSLLALFSFQFPELISPKFEAWYAWFAIAVHVAGFVAGIIALVKVKGKPKQAGFIFLITGVFMLVLTLGATLIQTVLFMIVGLMCLLRKESKQKVTA